MNEYEGFEDTSVSSKDLAILNELAQQMLAAQIEVAKAEEATRLAQARLTELSDRMIPDLMDEIGVKTFTTSGGLKVEVKRTLRCSIPADRKAQALKWLDDNGHSGLIKRNIVVGFDRDQTEEARKLRKSLEAKFENVKEDSSVHPSTLKAFLTEQLKEGAAIPLELFGAWEQRQAKITTS